MKDWWYSNVIGLRSSASQEYFGRKKMLYTTVMARVSYKGGWISASYVVWGPTSYIGCSSTLGEVIPMRWSHTLGEGLRWLESSVGWISTLVEIQSMRWIHTTVGLMSVSRATTTTSGTTPAYISFTYTRHLVQCVFCIVRMIGIDSNWRAFSRRG